MRYFCHIPTIPHHSYASGETQVFDRALAAQHILQAGAILAETWPELTVVGRNAIIRGFDRGTLRVRTLTEEVGAFQYYQAAGPRAIITPIP